MLYYNILTQRLPASSLQDASLSRTLRAWLAAVVLTVAAAVAMGLTGRASAEGDGPIRVVAAQNFYGDIAVQIGGDRVAVTSILDGPAGDPHAFEITPSIARAVSEAAVVIHNGADYDHWMDHLLAATSSRDRAVIVAATLVGAEAGGNPHLWYAPATARRVASALADELARRDPAYAAGYRQRLAAFATSFAAIDAEIAAIRGRYAGAAVTATESVFGRMIDALGLEVRNAGYQLAVLNETEPSPRDIAAFEDDLRGGQVRVLFHNRQVEGRLGDHFVRLATETGVPVVEVSETMPAGATFQDWLLGQLAAVSEALGEGSR